MAMGPTPNCNGCKAIARGDPDHKPHSQECRERVVEWLKRQDDERVQARLTAAQMRQEAQRREVEDKRRKEEELKEKKRKRQGPSQPGEARPPVKANAPPPAAARVQTGAQASDDLNDEWVVTGKRVIRHIRNPRFVTFLAT